MITDELRLRIHQSSGFELTEEQAKAADTFCAFATDRHDRTAMILKGSAGTGKTTLAGAIVKALVSLRQKIILLAPTGRAAKVFSMYAGHAAFTVHRRIYRQKSVDSGMSGFRLNDNLYADTLFIVDEASMVANGGDGGFGSGCLLDDLVSYVYSGRNCRLMLIGDKAQLPPVGEEESPALSAETMRGYGLDIYVAELNEVMRQSRSSGILSNATAIRRMITHDEITGLPVIRFSGFADISIVRGDELVEQLASSYSREGTDGTMVITRSNKRANIYNRGIRNMVLGREEELTTGDMLMIVRNNYHWTERELKSATDPEAAMDIPAFIANGDIARVRRVRNQRELYGFRFADITLVFPDYNDYELTATAVLDTLAADAPALTHEQNEQLLNAVMDDYADVPLKADRMKRLRQDAFFNALQIKYAYAVTCHKAQGGQWAHIYIDQGYMTDNMLTPDYIHWLYTAFTRATDHLFLVNWPKEQTAGTDSRAH